MAYKTGKNPPNTILQIRFFNYQVKPGPILKKTQETTIKDVKRTRYIKIMCCCSCFVHVLCLFKLQTGG